MTNHPELDLDYLDRSDPEWSGEQFMNAADLASDQDQPTWLTRDGKRVAAIVPVDVLEHGESRLAMLLRTKNPS
jgi:hypothetical protein